MSAGTTYGWLEDKPDTPYPYLFVIGCRRYPIFDHTEKERAANMMAARAKTRGKE